MSANTKIEWADHTFNPWEGCVKVGPGCDNCYAEARNARFGGGVAVNWGPAAPRRHTSAANWRQPIAWDNAHAEFHAAHGRRQRVFCASLADVFDNAVPVAWRIELLYLIYRTPHLDWMLLTKRIGNALYMLEQAARNLVGGPPTWWNAKAWPNVWIGATIVNQEEADRDIAKLLQVNAAVRFLSMEPLLGPVTFRWASWVDHDKMTKAHGHVDHLDGLLGIDWIIAGGESGPNARPSHPDWYRTIRDQCTLAEVPFLFKQWGEWIPRDAWNPRAPKPQCAIRLDGSNVDDDTTPQDVGGHRLEKIGKKAAGRELDGRTHDDFPEGWPA